MSLLLRSGLLVLALALAARGAEPDGPAAREMVSKIAVATFQAGDYAGLEKNAAELRSTKARFPEGVWKLPSFYDGLKPRYGGSKPDWQECFKKLDAWKAAFPESVTQPVVRAGALTDYAWEARGGGYANTVTTDGWKLFGERLTQARGVLEEAAKLPTRDPDWYRVMQSVALGEGWDHDRYLAMFEEAVAAEPTYYHYYFNRITAELPRWGGEPDAWVDFADEAARKYDPKEGLSIYARIVWSHVGAVGGGLQNPKVDWTKVRQGFRDIEKQYPSSGWNLNNFCKFACQAGDRETARELFGRIGDAVSVPAWDSRTAFEGWRRWANAADGADTLRASLALPTDESLMTKAVAFSPDGKLLLAGYDDGGIRLWDLAAKKVVWGANLRSGKTSAVAFSRDGTLFAAGTGDEYDNATAGSVKIWQTGSREPVAKFEVQRGNVFGLAFLPDGKTLVVVGGAFGDNGGKPHYGEAALYDLAAKKLGPAPWEGGKYVQRGVTVSADGQLLATTKGRSINGWSLAKGAFIGDFHTRATHADTVQAVAFAPDGKTLVTGAAAAWADRGRGGGGLRRWNAAADGWPEVKEPAWEAAPSGVLALAYSPDGRWLAAGGYDGSVLVWDTSTGKIAATLTGHNGRIGAVAFAPDGKTLATGAADGSVRWWNAPGASMGR